MQQVAVRWQSKPFVEIQQVVPVRLQACLVQPVKADQHISSLWSRSLLFSLDFIDRIYFTCSHNLLIIINISDLLGIYVSRYMSGGVWSAGLSEYHFGFVESTSLSHCSYPFNHHSLFILVLTGRCSLQRIYTTNQTSRTLRAPFYVNFVAFYCCSENWRF